MATSVLDFPHNPDTDGVAAFCPGILEVQGPLGVDMCNEGVGNEERGSNQIVVVAPSPSSREQAEMSGPAAVLLAEETERCGRHPRGSAHRRGAAALAGRRDLHWQNNGATRVLIIANAPPRRGWQRVPSASAWHASDDGMRPPGMPPLEPSTVAASAVAASAVAASAVTDPRVGMIFLNQSPSRIELLESLRLLQSSRLRCQSMSHRATSASTSVRSGSATGTWARCWATV